MATSRVQFRDSLLHHSLEDLQLPAEQTAYLTDGVLAGATRQFYTEKTECEVLWLQPEEDKTKMQLRLTHLMDDIQHKTLAKVVEALHGILVNWTLQFDAQRMHLILVIIFVNRSEEASYTEDRSKKRRHRVAGVRGDTVAAGPQQRTWLRRLQTYWVDHAAGTDPLTSWMKLDGGAQGVLKKDEIAHKLGSVEDTAFVIQLLQTIVGQEEQIPRIFVALTTREGQTFVLHVGGFLRWTSAQHAFIMDLYGVKIDKVTYGYSRDYNGLVNFTVKRAKAILE